MSRAPAADLPFVGRLPNGGLPPELPFAAGTCACGAEGGAACRCETFVHPRAVLNSPGRTDLAYRLGDYASFRHAMLLARPGETELSHPDGPVWRPGPRGDLALQLLEWWAYLADVLTFYTERAANESYLATAQLPESVNRLIRLLGYRPRPGIAARGVLAAVLSGNQPVAIPAGLQFQTKPGPGKQPQIFEADAETTARPPSDVATDAAAASLHPLQRGGPGASAGGGGPFAENILFLKGAVKTLKKGDVLLIRGGPTPATLAMSDIGREKDPRGKPITRVTLDGITALGDVAATGITVSVATQAGHPWQFAVTTKVFEQVNSLPAVHLDALARTVAVGDPVVAEETTGGIVSREALTVGGYAEFVWNANAPGTPEAPDPTIVPGGNTPAVPIPHSQLAFAALFSGKLGAVSKATWVFRYGFREVAPVVPAPAPKVKPGASGTLALTPAAAPGAAGTPPPVSLGDGDDVLLEDADGVGALAVTSAADGTTLHFAPPIGADPLPPLVAPVRVFPNLVPVSRGKTVAHEILGSGDATRPGQEFVLQNAPLTYLPSGDSASGAGYSSTLRVWVNGIEWKEVPSFFGRPADARVFVTREDGANKTHVLFGDGRNGARLPSGVGNVVARYRYGSGRDAPEAGTLTVLLQPRPGLRAVRNPVAVGGGADPDDPAKVRRLAPRSVLAFDRAVSADDFEALAGQTPGVTRARAYFAFDPDSQRAAVTVYVAGDAQSQSDVRAALAAAADPNQPFKVKSAAAVRLTVTAAVVPEPGRIAADVKAAARAALLDPDAGLFAPANTGVGRSLYESQLDAALTAVPGVAAVHDLVVNTPGVTCLAAGGKCKGGRRWDPLPGEFFDLADADLDLSEGVAHG